MVGMALEAPECLVAEIKAQQQLQNIEPPYSDVHSRVDAVCPRAPMSPLQYNYCVRRRGGFC